MDVLHTFVEQIQGCRYQQKEATSEGSFSAQLRCDSCWQRSQASPPACEGFFSACRLASAAVAVSPATPGNEGARPEDELGAQVEILQQKGACYGSFWKLSRMFRRRYSISTDLTNARKRNVQKSTFLGEFDSPRCGKPPAAWVVVVVEETESHNWSYPETCFLFSN